MDPTCVEIAERCTFVHRHRLIYRSVYLQQGSYIEVPVSDVTFN